MRTLQATPADVMLGRPRPLGECEDDLRWSDTGRRLYVHEPVRLQPPRRYEAVTLEQWRAEQDPPVCPYCGRVMSKREAAEQGACNDCYGDRR